MISQSNPDLTNTDQVCIFEVGPRDGLQNETGFIETADKVRLIDLLSNTGISRIEVTSFVSPKWVPQMADAKDVFEAIGRTPNIRYAALTPNLKGYRRAREAGANEVAIFGAASETFSQKNINCSIAESIERFKPVIEAAKADDMPVRSYVSCIIECPFEGAVAPDQVARLAEIFITMGCYEISLGDTTGAGVPETVIEMLNSVTSAVPVSRLAGHFHDTGGRAVDNIKASLDLGLRTFDTSVGGLGGCPYAPGSPGNAATGKVVNLLNGLGIDTGIDIEKLNEAEIFARQLKEGRQ
ncbi:MAG: hydroxymethylglutaryl-CoA lyase [Rhodospirillales bacterium]|jgi:hydroxymethylglutaryl-CoA lyase|nr:hydroxymethylglutaryl-CoA lyase [Rhodospirillaceae bacterium]MDP6429103.1 hydroxymethylglutaryl-CoA lyase [Rhodospirillales bacterium]MDP6645780.1 hydroxymethylglutaryl-CoA lyase [Rhodospirillales bacterium]|tara:strand:- start:1157 stop:2047 length:891 start_codon:yes stop_codon:yes gene_type:complete